MADADRDRPNERSADASIAEEAPSNTSDRLRAPILLVTVLIIATAGLVYELLAATVASYVLGDSVTQFSTTIGVYLFAMGVGSYLSRFVDDDLARRFVEVELAIALVGGASAPFLFAGFAYATSFRALLYATLLVIGTLVGLEIPLLMRILRGELDFRDLVARVLTFDYIGALFGSVLFALFFVPRFGLNRTSLLFGAANAAVALLSTWVLARRIAPGPRVALRVVSILLIGALGLAFALGDRLTASAEQRLYTDPIVFAEQSAYQRIVVTKGRRGLDLLLNGNLQFNSRDEYRYHEALVHPAFAAARAHARVLILGGGDGLALREVLRYPDVEQVTLVDLDPAITDLARRFRPLVALNRGSMRDPRVRVVNDDAMVWIDRHADEGPFDVVLVDFPDPNNYSLGKLYTRRFYRLVRRIMTDSAALAVQSTSPLDARRSFWCVAATMEAAGFAVHPYHAPVPSFGEWGYVLAEKAPFDPPQHLRISDLRFLDDGTLQRLFDFSPDMAEVPVEINVLNNQRLVHYYAAEWGGG
ncbi:MAG: polyamine aminopropyltransferase [Myxococcales bacterium]|nr:polyamine aminopropyltransferase [Myxococcales bacterium]